MTIHIMLDLETWGRTPGSDIRSIGACVFDPVNGNVVGFDQNAPVGHRVTSLDGKFHIATENPKGRWRNGEFVPELAKNENERLYPLTRDPDTVQWWSEQSAEAQSAFANPVDLRQAVCRFADWFISVADGSLTDDIRLWCNGPHFDEAILAAVYRAVNLPVPWHFRAPRDFRTVTELAGMEYGDYSNYGDAHNALHDAIAQAMTVCEAYKRLGLSR